MGGAGTSKGTSQTTTPYAGELAAIGSQLWGMAKPTLQALSAQTATGLQTGGVNAQIPIINANVAAAREAFSQHQANLRRSLAASGLANSSFAQEILAEDTMSGTQQIASMPASLTADFLGRAVPTVAGAAQTGVGAIGTAGAQTPTTTTTGTPSFLDWLQQGLLTANTLATPFSGKGGGGGASPASTEAPAALGSSIAGPSVTGDSAAASFLM